MRLIDLTSQRFGRLSVISRAANKAGGKHVAWTCICDCGTTCVATTVHLRSGHTTSCGCYVREVASARLLQHGHAAGGVVSSEHQIWAGAKERCLNPNNPAYARYGGRGIRICDDWRDSFAAFFADMGPRPDGMTLDRIDTNGDYAPGNCRWATRTEQSSNRRNNIVVMYEGERVVLKEAARRAGVNYHALYRRVKRGETLPDALAAMRGHLSASTARHTAA